jgi:hypothetical protein
MKYISAWYRKVSQQAGGFRLSGMLTCGNTEHSHMRKGALGGRVYMNTCRVQVCLRINLCPKNQFALFYFYNILITPAHTCIFVPIWYTHFFHKRFNKGIICIWALLALNTEWYLFAYWHLQNSLTQWIKVLIEKLIVAHQVKKCSPSYEALNLCMILKNTFRWSLSWAKWPGEKIIFNIIPPFLSGSLQVFRLRICMKSPHAFYIQLIPHDLIHLIDKFGEYYILLSSSLCNYHHPPVPHSSVKSIFSPWSPVIKHT